ncbi:MAG: GNAT family N-acetyltransferase [Actinomycetota bacterium]|nr:GNAT family N-acetyltransferase [Actinomycetota bacterium]
MDEVTLRDVRDEDVPILFPFQLDPEATEMAAFPARDWGAFSARWAKTRADETALAKVIEFNGEVAGDVGSWLDSGHRNVGYWIGRKFWGRGIATAALSQFLAYVEERPIYAHVAVHNVGSKRVLEKCGFTVSHDVLENPDAPDDDVEEVLMKLG